MKIYLENLDTKQLLSECGLVLRIAPPSLSRDRRIKIKKSINLTLQNCLTGLYCLAYTTVDDS